MTLTEAQLAIILCDGANLTVNDIPWREMLQRVNAITDIQPTIHGDTPTSPPETRNP